MQLTVIMSVRGVGLKVRLLDQQYQHHLDADHLLKMQMITASPSPHQTLQVGSSKWQVHKALQVILRYSIKSKYHYFGILML